MDMATDDAHDIAETDGLSPPNEPIYHIATLVERLQRDAGRAVPSDALCLAIWPDRPWQASIHSLRQLVYVARKTLPPDAISTTLGYGYAWTGEPTIGL